MNPQTQRQLIDGAAGSIEVLIDAPSAEATHQGVAVIAHPHPLRGGTMDNKVVQTLARAFVARGWTAVRFNFRGVGQTQGVHDNGVGESQDMLRIVETFAPQGRLALAGFSFGAFVASKALQILTPQRTLEHLILVGTAAGRFEVSDIPPELHERTLVVHGESDDVVTLADVLAWARPQLLPVTVVPGGTHFFHGHLPLLKTLVMNHLCMRHL